jgi:hypothetical protein
MNFSEALIAMKMGRSIRRSSWRKDIIIYIPSTELDQIIWSQLEDWRYTTSLPVSDILANDWQII